MIIILANLIAATSFIKGVRPFKARAFTSAELANLRQENVKPLMQADFPDTLGILQSG